MDKLFGYEYVQGYTAALQDVLKTLGDMQTDLKIHKRKQNYKTYKAIVECMLKKSCCTTRRTRCFYPLQR